MNTYSLELVAIKLIFSGFIDKDHENVIGQFAQPRVEDLKKDSDFLEKYLFRKSYL